jgi:hypothetical protein
MRCETNTIGVELAHSLGENLLNQKSSETPEADSKKPYTKPDFRSERVFAVAAIACGKVAGTGGNCNIVKKAS